MKKSVLIFLFMLAPSLCAMEDDNDRPFLNKTAHLLTKDDYEMRKYEDPDDATYREDNLYFNEFATLNRKMNALARAHHYTMNKHLHLAGIQCGFSALLSCSLVLAFSYIHQGATNQITESMNYITQRIDNLAAQCSCPQMPPLTTQTPNTTDNTTNPLYTPTDTAFLNMISGNMSTNQTND